MSDQEQHDDPAPARQRRDFRAFQNLIDKLIGEARTRGSFDEVAGQGKPLEMDDDTLVPAEDRLGYRMLKTHGFAPPWIEARRDIDGERESIERWLARANTRWPTMHEAQRVAMRVEYRKMLVDLRRMILNYNLTAPAAAGQVEGLNLERELARLGQNSE
jgi:hypothetical protein